MTHTTYLLQSPEEMPATNQHTSQNIPATKVMCLWLLSYIFPNTCWNHSILTSLVRISTSYINAFSDFWTSVHQGCFLKNLKHCRMIHTNESVAHGENQDSYCLSWVLSHGHPLMPHSATRKMFEIKKKNKINPTEREDKNGMAFKAELTSSFIIHALKHICWL